MTELAAIPPRAATDGRVGTLLGAGLAAATLILLSLVFGEGVLRMVAAWNTESASHGWLVVPAVAWLVWSRREELARIPARGSWTGLPIIAGALALQLLAVSSSVYFIPPLALLFTLGGLVVLLFGWRIARALAFPYAFAFFMVPWPDFLTTMLSFPLQIMSAGGATMLVGMFLPVSREGQTIYIEAQKFPLEVAEACSGIRSLTALLAVAALFACFLPRDGRCSAGGGAWWRDVDWRHLGRQWSLFLCGIPLAMAANIIRVALIVVVGHIAGKAPALKFHDWSSYLLFPLTIAGLWLARRWLISRTPVPSAAREAAEVVPADAPRCTVAAPEVWGESRRWGVALLLVAATFVLAGRVRAAQFGPFHTDFDRVPISAGSWRGSPVESVNERARELLKPDAVLDRAYLNTRTGAWVYLLAVYGHEKDTFHSPDQCIPGSGSLIKIREVRRLPVAGLKEPINANLRVYKGEDRQFLAVYWFAQNGDTHTSLIPHVWGLLASRFTRQNPTGALVRLVIPFEGEDHEPAVVMAQDLLNQVYPSLDATFRADNTVKKRVASRTPR